MTAEADLVLVNGRIVTWSPEVPTATAVALGGGRILAVGERPEAMGYAGLETRVIDVGGRLVLPGFTDAHAHLATTGGRMDQLALESTRSLGELQTRVREAAAQSAGEWVLGGGWDESRWRPATYPTLSDLDGAAPSHPVALSRVDGHMTVVNSRALQALSPASSERVERRPDGTPSGIFREAAADAIWGELRPSVDTLVAGIRRMTIVAHRLGITSIHDTVDVREMQAYLRLHEAGDLGLRVNLMPKVEEPRWAEGEGAAPKDPALRQGPAKVFLDGSLGSRTAALGAAFDDEAGNRGLPMAADEFRQIVKAATRGNYQLALHAIGDRAIDLALEGLARANGRERDRIEHFELPEEAHLRLARRLGVVASMQPNFVGQWSLPGGMYERRLGPERVRHNNPFRLIVDAGIPLVFGSDHMPFSPLYGVHWAVHGPYEDQRLTVEEALRAYTQTAAYASFEEDRKGTVAPGQVADLVVLEKDPFQRPDRIEEIPVHLTVFDGQVVYEAR